MLQNQTAEIIGKLENWLILRRDGLLYIKPCKNADNSLFLESEKLENSIPVSVTNDEMKQKINIWLERYYDTEK